MIKISHKVIIGVLISFTIGTVCIACETVSNTAIPTPPNDSQISSEIIDSSSEIVSSSEVSISSSVIINSKSESSLVSNNIVSKNQNISSSVSSQKGIIKMAENTSNNTNNSSETSSQSVSTSTTKKVGYAVINPETGIVVYSNDPNYEKYKAELGGDAGTKPTKDSTACQAALERIKAKNAQSSSSNEGSPD